MILKDEVVAIGKLVKTHGTNGEINFTTHYDIFEMIDVPFIVLEPQGLFVPFYIEDVRMRDDELGIIKLERIDSDNVAAEYIGMTLYVSKVFLKELDDEDLDVGYFVGYDLLDVKKGRIGKIVELDDSTENILFSVEREDEDELLVPAVDAFVVEIDHDKRVLIMDLPLGLLEL